jgi:glycosyltransferase involved in cell wall biosynthesis
MRWRDVVVAVSEAVKDDVRRKLLIPEEKVRVIYNGVDVEKYSFHSPEARLRLRAEWDIPFEAVVAIMVSRLHPQKNPLGLLEAFASVADRARKLMLIYVGDGPQQTELEEAVRKSGVSDRVRVVGPREDIPDVLAACDISVLPSLKEGFSNTILESMAASLPVLCTDVGGNSEVVVHGKTGLLEPAGDVEALARGLRVLAMDSALRKVFADSARARVRRFSLDRMAQDTIDLYDELLKRKGLM